MTKEYIHRELILGQLGYKINPDVKVYIDFFDELVGDINGLNEIKMYKTDFLRDCLYTKDNTVLFIFKYTSSMYHINYKIWLKFERKFNIKYQEIDELLTIILNYKFNNELYFSGHLPNKSHNDLVRRYL